MIIMMEVVDVVMIMVMNMMMIMVEVVLISNLGRIKAGY